MGHLPGCIRAYEAKMGLDDIRLYYPLVMTKIARKITIFDKQIIIFVI